MTLVILDVSHKDLNTTYANGGTLLSAKQLLLTVHCCYFSRSNMRCWNDYNDAGFIVDWNVRMLLVVLDVPLILLKGPS